VTPFEVLLTRGAEHDLEEIYDYIAHSDSAVHADRLLDRLLATIARLATQPQRGTHPRELQALGIHDYRQVFFKPYRMIYRVIDNRVVIYLIADGRRDMQSLLSRRLLSA
jgi:toxin ParE1/3/4